MRRSFRELKCNYGIIHPASCSVFGVCDIVFPSKDVSTHSNTPAVQSPRTPSLKSSRKLRFESRRTRFRCVVRKTTDHHDRIMTQAHNCSIMTQDETSSPRKLEAMTESTNCVHHTNAPAPINMHQEDSTKGVSHHTFSSEQVKQAFEAPIPPPTSEEPEEGGILASGLDWLQRKREQRRRKNLQQQAELQLRKIYEAERRHSEQDSETNDNDSVPEDPNRPIGESKSGQGASGKLLISSLEEDDEFTPDVQVQPDVGTPRPHILNKEQMNQVAALVLPQTISFCRWRRLYDLGRDGDSFDGCLRIVSDTRRTLMVVRTTKGDVFGGYADSAWNANHLASARFYGNATACLFSVIPGTDTIKVFKWAGKNRYIQLCDTSRKMFAFGGGGDDGAFGLAVEEDFQRGSTGNCDTFDNEPLCEQGHFEIVDLEIWEFLTGVF